MVLSEQKQNDLIERACQQRAWARALAVQQSLMPVAANFPKKEGKEPGKDQE